MTGDLLLLAAAVLSVVVIFGGVLLLGDFQTQSCRQTADQRRPTRRAF